MSERARSMSQLNVSVASDASGVSLCNSSGSAGSQCTRSQSSRSSGSEYDSSYMRDIGNRSRKFTKKTAEGKTLVITPWYPNGIVKSKLNLNDEIQALHALLSLTPEETAKRHAVRSAIQDCLQYVWPGATVKVYGSFAYGLSLPHSAVDLVVESCDDLGDIENVLQRMAESNIGVENWMTSTEAAYAKVRLPGLGCTASISFVRGKSTARKSVTEIRKLIEKFPAVADAYAVIRLVLQQSRCADAATGGLPSYAALVMILHVCYNSENAADPTGLLMDFCRFYSDNKSTSAGIFVEDPLNEENNVAEGCTRMPQIRSILKNCLMTLEKWTQNKWDGYRGRTPLSSIIAYDNLWGDARPGQVRYVAY